MRRYSHDYAFGRDTLAYVSPGSVRYNTEDIAFLFDWLLEMREGVGPHDPGAGYTGGGRGGVKDHAHYEAWCKVAAEIDLRLKHTYYYDRRRKAPLIWDGLVAERYLYYDHELSNPDPLTRHDCVIEAIAREIHRGIPKVEQTLQSVLSYISSGPCPRWLVCVDCRDYLRCSLKKTPPQKFLKNPRGLSYEQWKGQRVHQWERY